MGVRVEPLGGDKMNYNNSKTNTSTSIKNVQNNTLSANHTVGVIV
jgi:hypothetical protein